MQMESFDQAGRNMAADAIAAEGALKQLSAQHGIAIGEDFKPRKGAIYGLAVAVPLSLTIWAALGALVWMIVR